MHVISGFPLSKHVLSLMILPLHMTPFPVYPVLQVQKKDPSVLVHFEFRLQLSIDSEHSSMSISEKITPIMFLEFVVFQNISA